MFCRSNTNLHQNLHVEVQIALITIHTVLNIYVVNIVMNELLSRYRRQRR